jgi:phosphatidylglycerophosphatase C
MRVESAEAISNRIRAARESRTDGFVAFDGDGTLWTGDLGEELFDALMNELRFEPDSVAEMERYARKHDVTWDGTTAALVRQLDAAFRAGAFPEDVMYELHAWAMAGLDRAAVVEYVVDLVTRTGVHARLQAEAVSVLETARRDGLDVFIVSASPLEIVEAAAALVGVAADHIVAATPRYDGPRMLADVYRPIPYGPGKVVNLAKRTGGRPLLAAFGDSAFDAAMLKAAAVGVAVRPKQRLRDIAGEIHGIVELAR